MTANLSDGFKMASQSPPHEEKKEDDAYVSYDAPPLDFSFKNIKHISGTSHQTQNSKTLSHVKAKKVCPALKRASRKLKNRIKRRNMVGRAMMVSTKQARKRTKSSS